MAKLHARGRREIIRFSKTIENPNAYCVKNKHTIAVMDDGKVLEKTTRWCKYEYSLNGKGIERRDGDWSIKSVIKSKGDLIYLADHFFENYKNQGYEKEKIKE